MKKIAFGIVVIIIVLGVGGWSFITQAPSAPSEDITAGTKLDAPAPAGAGEEIADSVGEKLYRISQDESVVAFNIDEVLRGEDFTVVGVTNQVAGDVVITDDDLVSATFGPVRVNARTLQTDSSNRDGAISRAILRSEQPENEFIDFVVTNVKQGAFGAGENETPVSISGDLTVAGVTQPVTFEGQLEQVTPSQIRGHAEAVINYKDFNLIIPEVPFVADVSDEVLLVVDFIANQV